MLVQEGFAKKKVASQTSLTTDRTPPFQSSWENLERANMTQRRRFTYRQLKFPHQRPHSLKYELTSGEQTLITPASGRDLLCSMLICRLC